jgi:hypothetical protein
MDMASGVIMVFECEKYRLSIGILSIDQSSSIIQFFLQSEFMFLDFVLLVGQAQKFAPAFSFQVCAQKFWFPQG